MDVMVVLGIFFVGFMVGVVCCAVTQVRIDRDRREQTLAALREEWGSEQPKHAREFNPDDVRGAAWPEDAA